MRDKESATVLSTPAMCYAEIVALILTSNLWSSISLLRTVVEEEKFLLMQCTTPKLSDNKRIKW